MARDFVWEFGYKDWVADTDLHYCSWLTRGIWIEMLVRMCDARETGKLEATPDSLCGLIGCSRDSLFTALLELYEHKVADIEWPNEVKEILKGYPQSYPVNFPQNIHTPSNFNILTFRKELRDGIVRKLSEICHDPIKVVNRRLYRDFLKRQKDAERKRKKREEEKLEEESSLFDVQEDVQEMSGVEEPSDEEFVEKVESSPSNKGQIKIFDESTVEFKLSLLLRKLILRNNPNAKVPPVTPKGLSRWADSIDKMIRIDNRETHDIADVIEWSQNDDFWMENILSTGKLRKQYDRLWLKMIKEREKRGGRKSTRTYDSPSLGN
jgi:hypothetical protein